MAEKKVSVKVGEYKGIPVQKRSAEVTEQELADELERARTYAATTQDKPEGVAEMGDQVVIDFVGYIDDSPFEGGNGADYPIILGSNTFIPGFEEQLVGAKAGDRVDVYVPFPDDYQDERYAGRDAHFEVDIKDLRTTQIPELTDEVVVRISPCETVDEFEEFVQKEIQRHKEEQNREDKADEVLTLIVESSDIDIPQELLEERAALLKNNIISQLSGSGNTFEDYLDYYNLTEEIFDEYNTQNALNMLRGQAVLGEIARLEGITCSSEDLEKELYLMGKGYQASADEMREMLGEEGVRMVEEDILCQKALDFAVKESLEA